MAGYAPHDGGLHADLGRLGPHPLDKGEELRIQQVVEGTADEDVTVQINAAVVVEGPEAYVIRSRSPLPDGKGFPDIGNGLRVESLARPELDLIVRQNPLPRLQAARDQPWRGIAAEPAEMENFRYHDDLLPDELEADIHGDAGALHRSKVQKQGFGRRAVGLAKLAGRLTVAVTLDGEHAGG